MKLTSKPTIRSASLLYFKNLATLCRQFFVAFLISNAAYCVNAANSTTLKISVIEDNPPFSFKLPNGRIAGFYIDIWNLWSAQTGQPIEFIAADYFDNISSLKNGEVDFHSGLFINSKRLEWADFSIPIHSVSTARGSVSQFQKNFVNL